MNFLSKNLLALSITPLVILLLCFQTEHYLQTHLPAPLYHAFLLCVAASSILISFLALRIIQKVLDSSSRNRLFLRKVIDANPNLIFVKDLEGRFTLVNQAVADIYGTTVDSIVGKRDSDFNPCAEEVEHFINHDRQVLLDGKEVFIPEEKITDASGRIHWLQTTKRLLQMKRDEPPQVLGVATDITENKRLYNQLVQSQKMEAIGQLAGGVAHDFNNYLTAMMGYTSLLKTACNHPREVEHAAAMIENIANKAAHLTQKLLGFARKGKNQNVSVDIHATIKETTSLLRRTIEKNVKIKQFLAADCSCILGDPQQMQQIILNLAINARDAISEANEKPDQGEITISTAIINLPDERMYPDLNLKPGKYLAISVEDNGCGVKPELKEKIFEPFFTTKAPEKGTGMGLAMVYGIVRNHGGTIKLDSEVGEGSLFTIYLPSHNMPATTYHKRSAVAHTGKGQILIVDDHQIILDVTSVMLTNLGYKVVTARDGFEAIKYFQENRDEIDLVILDMVMPNMGGRDCFKELRRLKPGVRAILSTGYGKNNAAQELLNEGILGFVQKPYQITKLSQVVAHVLQH